MAKRIYYQQVLSETDVLDIKELILKGTRQKDIAKHYEVSQAHISLIKNGKKRPGIDIDVDLTEKTNYWSYYAPHLSNKIIDLYNQGHSEIQITRIMFHYVQTIEPECRPVGDLHEADVFRILEKAGVEKRNKRRRSTKN